MWLRRDRCAIFHGCIPVDERGEFLPFTIDGAPRTGRALFDAFDVVVHRAIRTRNPDDIDLVFYLWTGPRSPCFGKDKMATFETYFLADKATQEEHKNPYFTLLNDQAFCAQDPARVRRRRAARLHHQRPRAGEARQGRDAGRRSPAARSRSTARSPRRTATRASRSCSTPIACTSRSTTTVDEGGDIVPTVEDVEVYDQPRTVGETEAGAELRAEIAALEQLAHRFRDQHHSRGPGGDMTLLDQLTKMTVVVRDTGDINSIKKFTPRDATTNPSLITAAAQMPEYAERRRRRARAGPKKEASGAEDKVIALALDRLAVEFGLRILKIVPGRVSTEVDARLSYDTQKTIEKGALPHRAVRGGRRVARARADQDRVDVGGHPRRRAAREGGHPLQPDAAVRHAPGRRVRRGRRARSSARSSAASSTGTRRPRGATATPAPRIRACCR